MWRNLDIDLVAPPFAGHLFPLLDLAGALHLDGVAGLSVLTTATGRDAIRLCGLPAVELLPGHDATVMAIADRGHRVGFHPWRLYRQFHMNLGLMAQLALSSTSAGRPDARPSSSPISPCRWPGFWLGAWG